MIKVDNCDITISRGDTGSLVVNFTDNIPADGTQAIVSLKRTLKDATSIWQKTLTVSSGKVTINLTSQDTDRQAGRYMWDLRLSYANNDLFTPIVPHEFNIVEVVGDVD